MPAEPASREPDASVESAPETTGEQARLDHFLEYRARAIQRRRTRWRFTASVLACGAVLLLIMVVTTAGSRLLRARMTPRPIVSPGIALPEPSASPPAASMPPATSAPLAAETPAMPKMITGTARNPTQETKSPVARAAPAPPEGPVGAESRPPARAATARITDDRREQLATVHPGDTKERLFDLFGTTFERQAGSVVRVDGMRLRARGRSPRYAQVEIADVRLADGLYWFAFGEGRLIAWGRRGDWRAVAQRHRLDVDYPP
jgi:hypothetical protein